MNEELPFEEFLAARMRDRNVTVKRLVEASGIAPSHLENMLHGNFDDMPSTPYFRGYVLRLGKVLDFDGEEWWARIKREVAVRRSGPADSLPTNRFIKKNIAKGIWAGGIVAVIVIIYLAVMLPRILGKPSLTVSFPMANPYTATSNTITISGVIGNADALYLSNDAASSSEQEIPVAADGSWQISVLLGDGPNSFRLSARKFLGGETDIVQQIIYESSSSTATSSSPTSTANYPLIHYETTTPATGTYFN